MNQFGIEEWPESLNDQVAMLRLEPGDIYLRAGLLFEESSDGLDYFEGCVVRLASGRLIALMRYKNNPVPGTFVVLEEGEFVPSLGLEQLVPILAELSILPDEVFWVRQE